MARWPAVVAGRWGHPFRLLRRHRRQLLRLRRCVVAVRAVVEPPAEVLVAVGAEGTGQGARRKAGALVGVAQETRHRARPSTAQVEPRKTESPAVEPPSVPAKPVPVPPVLKGRTMQALPARNLPGISPTARPLPPGLKPNPSAPLPPGVKPLPATVPAAPSADESGDSNEESRKAGSGS